MTAYKASTEKHHVFIPATDIDAAREKAQEIFKEELVMVVREAFEEELKCLPTKS